jgi:chromosomal replication initiation ATPase DnaA
LVAYLARKIAGHRVKDIAGHFGREPMTISQAIIKVEGLIQNDSAVEEKVRLLEKNLIRGGRKKYLITIA